MYWTIVQLPVNILILILGKPMKMFPYCHVLFEAYYTNSKDKHAPKLEYYIAFDYSWFILFPIAFLKSNESTPNMLALSVSSLIQFVIKADMTIVELFQGNLHNCLSKEQAFERTKFH